MPPTPNTTTEAPDLEKPAVQIDLKEGSISEDGQSVTTAEKDIIEVDKVEKASTDTMDEIDFDDIFEKPQPAPKPGPKVPKPEEKKQAQTEEEEEVIDDGEEVQGKEEVIEQAEQKQLDPQDQRPEHGLKRDYSKFKPEDQAYLRHTNNRVFNLLKDRLAKVYEIEEQNKKLQEDLTKAKSGALPDRYFEHPEAYTLSPEYQQLNRQYSRVDLETQHYRQQLINVEQGEKWQYIQGYTKDGQPVLSDPLEASPQAKVELLTMVNQAQTIQSNILQQANALKINFAQKHVNSAQSLEQATQAKINSLPQNMKPTDEDIQAYQKALSQAAPVYADHPMVKHAAQLYGVIQALVRTLNSFKQQNAQQVVVASDRKAAGPRLSSTATTKPTPKNNNKEIDFAQLEEEFNTH